MRILVKILRPQNLYPTFLQDCHDLGGIFEVRSKESYYYVVKTLRKHANGSTIHWTLYPDDENFSISELPELPEFMLPEELLDI